MTISPGRHDFTIPHIDNLDPHRTSHHRFWNPIIIRMEFAGNHPFPDPGLLLKRRHRLLSVNQYHCPRRTS